jgi:hypothetical protein
VDNLNPGTVGILGKVDAMALYVPMVAIGFAPAEKISVNDWAEIFCSRQKNLMATRFSRKRF